MSDDGRTRPDQRWDPGARYRPSVLAGHPVPAGATASGHAGAPTLRGRLQRGPAVRTAVFDREVWRPATPARQDRADALVSAAARYRRGALDTTGLVRAVGRALTA